MSKAFTKDDQAPEAPAEQDPADLVPAGAINYLTQAGHARFTLELRELSARPAGDPADDRRRRWLTRVLEISRPIDPATQTGDVVRLGATVVVRGTDDGAESDRTYRIVGIHEADAARGQISWTSPLARALLGAARGAVRLLKGPRGDEELEVVDVRFDSVDV